jgi:hypothetical protein
MIGKDVGSPTNVASAAHLSNISPHRGQKQIVIKNALFLPKADLLLAQKAVWSRSRPTITVLILVYLASMKALLPSISYSQIRLCRRARGLGNGF